MNHDPTAKPKLSAKQVKARKAARLQSLCLQMALYRAPDAQGITTANEIGAALELPATDAATLLGRKHLRDGD